MICIYKITSPSGKVYIGQTVNLKKRLENYKSLFCKQQPKLYASFKKHGYDNHKIEVIEICTREELNEREVYWIKHFNSFNTLLGLNLHSGGNANKICSDETRAKISRAGKGRKPSDKQRQVTSERMKGNNYAVGTKRSEEHKKMAAEIIGGFWRGKKMPDELKAKLSAAKLGKKMTPEQVEALKIRMKGKRPSEATLAARKAAGFSEETKAKISAAKKGKTFTEEHKQKLRDARKRFNDSLTEEQRKEHFGAALKGRVRPLEERLKISETLKKAKALS